MALSDRINAPAEILQIVAGGEGDRVAGYPSAQVLDVPGGEGDDLAPGDGAGVDEVAAQLELEIKCIPQTGS